MISQLRVQCQGKIFQFSERERKKETERKKNEILCVCVCARVHACRVCYVREGVCLMMMIKAFKYKWVWVNKRDVKVREKRCL